jgi:hypothetical protein
MSEHVRRQTVPQQMCTAHRRMEIGAPARTAHDRGDRARSREAAAGCAHAEKHAARLAEPPIAKVRRHGGPDVCWQREPLAPKLTACVLSADALLVAADELGDLEDCQQAIR